MLPDVSADTTTVTASDEAAAATNSERCGTANPLLVRAQNPTPTEHKVNAAIATRPANRRITRFTRTLSTSSPHC